MTNEATSERTTYQTIQHLERAAKDTSAIATQTIAAANAARPYLKSKQITETLIIECTETSRYIPSVIQRIKESKNVFLNAENGLTNGHAHNRRWEQFRAQSGLIHETSKLVQVNILFL